MSQGTPRDRLLEAAHDLFYKEGIAAVGVGRVIEAAEVGQMSLWRAFESKQGLVEAWLRVVDDRLLAESRAAVGGGRTPRERVAGLFDVCVGRALDVRFQGCPLVKASGEPTAAGPLALELVAAHKQAIRTMLAAASRDDGVRAPDQLAAQLLFLMEGVYATTGIGVDRTAAPQARSAALTLFDAAPRRSTRQAALSARPSGSSPSSGSAKGASSTASTGSTARRGRAKVDTP